MLTAAVSPLAQVGISSNGMSSLESCGDITCSQSAFPGRNAHVRAAVDQNHPLLLGPGAKLSILVDSVSLIFILWWICMCVCIPNNI